MSRLPWALLILISLNASASATEIPAPRSEELAASVRGLLRVNLPQPLVYKEDNWGNQVERVIGHGKRNHGIWRKIRVTAMDPATTLSLVIRDLQHPTPTLTQFQVIIGLDVQIDFEQIFWDHGVRLYSGSTRARARVKLVLNCEVESHAQWGKGFLPDLIFRIHVKSANLSYSGLDFLHIAGMGGDGAEVLGHSFHGLLKLLKPTLEKDLVAKADAAIVRAADRKEIRIGLNKLLSK